MRKMIEKIVEDTFQSSAGQIERITGFGEVNQVYKVAVDSDHYLIRLQEGRDAFREYRKEAWCMNQARKVQLNVPSVIAINEHENGAYMVDSFVDGINGSCHPDKLLVWHLLGDAARRLKDVPVQGFGSDLLSEDSGMFTDRFSSTLEKQIDYNVSQLTDDDLLIALGIYRPADQSDLILNLSRLLCIPYQPCLCHGDLSPYNILVSKDDHACLVDFGCARVHMAHYNLITAGIHTPAEWSAFLDGYGLSGEAFRKQEPEYTLFSLLHHFDTLRWAIDHRPQESWQPYIVQAKNAVEIMTQKMHHGPLRS